MNILLTNDDGIFSDGIRILAEKLAKKHDVVIAAPSSDCSCTSHSLTVFKKLSYEKYSLIKGVKGYSIKGTPSDCIKFATLVLLDKAPDLVISGINNMPNLGTDIIYSGTVNAALEGAICGVKSIALSILKEDESDYEFVADFIFKNLEKLYGLLTVNTIFNINFPSGKKDALSGVRFSSLGVQNYTDEYVMHVNEASERHYTLVGDMIKNPLNPEDCDVELNDKMFITITPVHIQMTDFETLKRLKSVKTEILL
ncbi:MAG: 5'/3'-nucleotidase SurE [Clostridiales bacterium]|jgi:5'-nucleotidase|nr:5'/3'-nucleotidase SurE [Clostridiales bacterium]